MMKSVVKSSLVLAAAALLGACNMMDPQAAIRSAQDRLAAASEIVASPSRGYGDTLGSALYTNPFLANPVVALRAPADSRTAMAGMLTQHD